LDPQSAINFEPAIRWKFWNTPKVEIVYALYRTPSRHNASVATFGGSRTRRCWAPTVAGVKRSDGPNGSSASRAISLSDHPDEKLNAAAAAIGQVTSIRQNYEPKIAAAAPSDKQRVTDEANNAMKKAVTDQGLTVDEYNSIIRTAQNDPGVRQKLSQRIPHSGQ
jgi:hypothetical protein